MLLFINGCTRSAESSQTYKLAMAYLKGWKESHPHEPLETVNLLEESIPILTHEQSEERSRQVALGNLDHPLLSWARTFAAAHEIVLAAPYWDLSYPAMVKVYLEHVCISGITFIYETGVMKPLCQAEKMTYITTSGGFIGGNHFGSDYIKGLCREFFGIPVVEVLEAQGLDIQEMDTSCILDEAIDRAYQAGLR